MPLSSPVDNVPMVLCRKFGLNGWLLSEKPIGPALYSSKDINDS